MNEDTNCLSTRLLILKTGVVLKSSLGVFESITGKLILDQGEGFKHSTTKLLLLLFVTVFLGERIHNHYLRYHSCICIVYYFVYY